MNWHQVPLLLMSKEERITVYKSILLENYKYSYSKSTNFFYAAYILFNAANLKQYKVKFKVLRPGYKPFSDKDLKNKLLDNAALEMDQYLLNKVIHSNFLTLTLDGWSSTKNYI